jgi:hypothetical protein
MLNNLLKVYEFDNIYYPMPTFQLDNRGFIFIIFS